MRSPMKSRSARHSDLTSNPAWVDRLMDRRWSAVESEVGAEMMPLRVDGKMEEYGCGNFGCVLPVSPGRVMKITTDSSEAAFVAAAMSFDEWPPGITPYYDILSLSDRYGELPVCLLWREEAYNVGALVPGSSRYDYYVKEFGEGNVAELSGGLDAFRWVADDVFELMVQSKKKFELAGEVALLRALPELPDADEWDGSESAYRMAFLSAHLDDIGSELAALRFGESVGYALRYYERRGLVLADVHRNNVGEIRHPDDPDSWDLAIIDPGVMVPLDPRWLRVNIPKI